MLVKWQESSISDWMEMMEMPGFQTWVRTGFQRFESGFNSELNPGLNPGFTGLEPR